jgi:hypothetical protein
MSLTRAVPRTLIHRREIQSCGYQREDGLWDIEAHLKDLKTETVPHPERESGYIPAGEPFHEMIVRLTIDTSLLIHDIQAQTRFAPFKMCASVADVYEAIKGTRISAGWLKECKSRTGGRLGCTHLNELLPVLATTAIQSLWTVQDEATFRQSASTMINTCQGWASDGEVVRKYLPEHYQGDPIKILQE